MSVGRGAVWLVLAQVSIKDCGVGGTFLFSGAFGFNGAFNLDAFFLGELEGAIDSSLFGNRLSWRRAHFARRGKIDQTYVNIHLNQISYAVKYSWNRVFNMDETCVQVYNSSIKPVAPIGVE